jgi:SSS family solute:Na+ symporter
MLTGVLAASMSALGAQAVTNSALFVRNLYQPVAPGRSEGHYIAVGRVVIVAILLGGIVTALYADNLLNLFKYFISVPAVFGASIWLGFTWRRVTKWATIVQVFFCFVLYAIIPNVFPALALAEDVAAGRADHVGQTIRKPHVVEPAGIFFEEVVRTDPADPHSPKMGRGRFQAETWFLSWFGVHFEHCRKAQLVAIRFLVDALLPFVLLFVLSALTRPVPAAILDRFFGTLHTPVQPTAAAEQAALTQAAAQPALFEREKLWPRSKWEILKPSWLDLAGFGGSWVLVGVVLLLLWLLVTIGT